MLAAKYWSSLRKQILNIKMVLFLLSVSDNNSEKL